MHRHLRPVHLREDVAVSEETADRQAGRHGHGEVGAPARHAGVRCTHKSSHPSGTPIMHDGLSSCHGQSLRHLRPQQSTRGGRVREADGIGSAAFKAAMPGLRPRSGHTGDVQRRGFAWPRQILVDRKAQAEEEHRAYATLPDARPRCIVIGHGRALDSSGIRSSGDRRRQCSRSCSSSVALRGVASGRVHPVRSAAAGYRNCGSS